MRKSVSNGLKALVVVGLLGALAPVASLAAEFSSLGVTCGPAFFPTFCVVDMSGDGNTILFQDRIWRVGSGFEAIGPQGYYQVTALSDDGSTVVGDYYVTDSPLGPHTEAAIWLGGDNWRPLGGLPNSGPCGSSWTSAYDVSNGGEKVVGLAWVGQDCVGSARAFEWTEENGIVDLGSIAANRASRANQISADGGVIAGWSDAPSGARLGAFWDHGAPPVWITPKLVPVAAGEVTGINSDGSILVGGGFSDNSNPTNPASTAFEPWLWSEATGLIHLGTVKGLRGALIDGQHYSRDVSDDGSVVVGQDTLFQLGEQWAFIWTKKDGIKALQDYVRARTDPATKAKLCPAQRSVLQPCSQWDLWNTAAITNDGKTIVGTGRNPQGNWEAFKVTLP